ncbi:trehalase-like domain-containing protein [Streptomyces sp. NPDC006235]|uniref:trehalase-like domain-containing protein n=1 Tax=Streptomyces sp. NPDC006235 TaxID=3156736 RepID=UPI0033A30004
MSQWSPAPHEGYLPIEDHGLIGDGRGCALVGRDGAISFMCVPRFDAPPLFCSLLDRHRGGSFLLAPEGLWLSRQHYIEDTGVLVTEPRADTGVVEITDAFLLRPGARLEVDAPVGTGELVRHARVTQGSVDLAVAVLPRGETHVERQAAGWHLTCPRQALKLHLTASRPLPGPRCTLSLNQGEDLWSRMRWSERRGADSGRSVSRAVAVLFMLAVINIIGLYLLAPVVKRELASFLEFVRARNAGETTDGDEDQESVKTTAQT